ncbi:hypothetical protein ES754_09535 [Psychrobacter frigidicola]|uniref:YbjN domain-containing protein n=1 Tax=Psychrobacter frigidicola TaxID=45611 RepID=A0A5C7A1M6_9GAMM|nr:YbjN domain-containing protein [Psychrobacter frigidicola]TXD96384.1 hypothetical protein ES754_09535 [Psychrobacter frigidicola]
MSHTNKRSLWQRIKRLLTTAAPQSVVDETEVPHSSPQADSSSNDLKSELNTDINENNKSTNPDDSNLPVSSNTQKHDFKSNDNDVGSSDSKSSDSNVSNEMPIVDYLKQYLYEKEWHYTYYRPKSSDSQQSHHLSLRMNNKQIDCGYLFRVQENNSLLAVYGILPFLIPESHQSAAMLLITQINYDMLIGNLEMDVNDGEIRYKNAIDVEVVGIDDYIIEHLLQSVIAMTTVAYEMFSDLVNTQDPAEELSVLLGELRQQADARTFFLPTQFVQ